MTQPPTLGDPSYDPDLSEMAVTTMQLVTGVFEAARNEGEDFHPMLMAVDTFVEDGPPDTAIIDFGEYAAMRATQIALASKALGDRFGRARTEMLLITDIFMASRPVEEKDDPDRPMPSDDPQAVEAMLVLYAKRPINGDPPEIVSQGMRRYSRADDGNIEWLDSLIGWSGIEPNAGPLIMAVAGSVTDVLYKALDEAGADSGVFDEHGITVIVDA